MAAGTRGVWKGMMCARPPCVVAVVVATLLAVVAHADRGRMPFTATAYSVEGRTAAGTRSREGVVAADPDVLPLGSRIRIHDAGQYSGVYVVQDTGRAIQGREVDIYLANDREAKRFGRRRVQVEVLHWGDGRGAQKTR